MNFLKNIFGQEPQSSPKFDPNSKKPAPDPRITSSPQDAPISGKDAHGIIQAPIIGNVVSSGPTEISPPEEEDDMFGGMEVKGEEVKESLYQPPVVEQKIDAKLIIPSPEITKTRKSDRTVVDKKRPSVKTLPTDSPIEETKIDLLDFTGMEFVPKRNPESDKLLNSLFEQVSVPVPVLPSSVVELETKVLSDSSDEDDSSDEEVEVNNFKDSILAFNKKKEEIFGKIHKLSLTSDSILKSRRLLLEEMNQIKGQLLVAQSDLDDYNKKIYEYTSLENYKAAEELDDKVKSVKTEIENLKTKLKNCKTKTKQIEKDKDSLPETIIATHKSFLAESDDLLEKQEENMKKFFSEQEVKLETEQDRLKSEESRLEREQETNEIDLKNVAKRIGKIQDQIKEQTKDARKTRDEYDSSLSVIKKEIEELEKKLKEKKKEVAKIEKSKKEVDDVIHDSERKFEKQLNVLKTDENEVLSRNEKWNQRKNRLKIDGENHKKDKESYEKDRSGRESVILDIRAQIKTSKKTVKNVNKQKQILSKFKREKMDDKEIKKLKKKRQLLEQEQSVVEKDVFQVDTKVDGLNDKLKIVTEKLNKLGNDKKLAVSVRDFKKAQNIQTEIKDQTTKEEEIRAALLVVEKEKIEIYSNLKDKKKQVEKLVNEMGEKEREMDLKLYKEQYKKEYVLSKLKIGEILALEYQIATLELKDLETKIDPSKDEIEKIREWVEKEYERDFESDEESESEDEEVVVEEVSPVPRTPETVEVKEIPNENGKDSVSPKVESPLVEKPFEKVEIVESTMSQAEFDEKIATLHSERENIESQLNAAIAEENYEICDELHEKLTKVDDAIKTLEIQRPKEVETVVVQQENAPEQILTEEPISKSPLAEEWIEKETIIEPTHETDPEQPLSEEKSAFDFISGDTKEETQNVPEATPEEKSAFDFMQEDESEPQPESQPEDPSAFDFIEK